MQSVHFMKILRKKNERLIILYYTISIMQFMYILPFTIAYRTHGRAYF